MSYISLLLIAYDSALGALADRGIDPPGRIFVVARQVVIGEYLA